MKKVLKAALAVMILAVAALAFTACDNTPDGGTAALHGTWDFGGVAYWTFNADGTGTEVGSPIRWQAENGTLRMCATPAICRSVGRCSAPSVWTYSFDGDELTLNNAFLGSFTYTRR